MICCCCCSGSYGARRLTISRKFPTYYNALQANTNSGLARFPPSFTFAASRTDKPTHPDKLTATSRAARGSWLGVTCGMEPTGGMKDGKQTLAQRLRAVWMTANLTRAWRSTSNNPADQESTQSKQRRLRQSLEDAFDRLADSVEGIAPSHLYPLVYSTNKDVLRWCRALLEARSVSDMKDTLETLDFDHALEDDARGDDARSVARRGVKLVVSYCPVAVLVIFRRLSFAVLVAAEGLAALTELLLHAVITALQPRRRSVSFLEHGSSIAGMINRAAEACIPPTPTLPLSSAIPCYPHDSSRDGRKEVRISCRVTNVHELNAKAGTFTASVYVDITWRLDARELPHLAQMIRLIGSEPHREYESVAEKLLRRGAGELVGDSEPLLSVLANQLTEGPHLLWNPQIELRNLDTPDRQAQWYQVFRDWKGRPVQDDPQDALLLISERRRVRHGVFSSPMHMGQFPVDRQQLIIHLRARKRVHEVHLTDAGLVSRWQSGVSTSSFSQRAEWNLSPRVHMVEMETDPSESSNAFVYPELCIVLRVSRRPGVYVWDILLPMGCICMLSLSSFALRFSASSGAGDRLSIVLVAVLTFFNFKSTATMDDLPKVSYQTSMDYYLFVCFALLVLVMLANTLVIVGSESRLPCGGLLEDGALEDSAGVTVFPERATWKLYLFEVLDAWMHAVNQLFRGSTTGGAAPASFSADASSASGHCSDGGVDITRFELLNETFALSAFGVLVLIHGTLALWLSHHVLADARWVRDAPPFDNSQSREEREVVSAQTGERSAPAAPGFLASPSRLRALLHKSSRAMFSGSPRVSPGSPGSPAMQSSLAEPSRSKSAQRRTSCARRDARRFSTLRSNDSIGGASREMTTSFEVPSYLRKDRSLTTSWAHLLKLSSQSHSHADSSAPPSHGTVWSLAVNKVSSQAKGVPHTDCGQSKCSMPGAPASLVAEELSPVIDLEREPDLGGASKTAVEAKTS